MSQNKQMTLLLLLKQDGKAETKFLCLGHSEHHLTLSFTHFSLFDAKRRMVPVLYACAFHYNHATDAFQTLFRTTPHHPKILQLESGLKLSDINQPIAIDNKFGTFSTELAFENNSVCEIEIRLN
jgi:hypothetical protein